MDHLNGSNSFVGRNCVTLITKDNFMRGCEGTIAEVVTTDSRPDEYLVAIGDEKVLFNREDLWIEALDPLYLKKKAQVFQLTIQLGPNVTIDELLAVIALGAKVIQMGNVPGLLSAANGLSNFVKEIEDQLA